MAQSEASDPLVRELRARRAEMLELLTGERCHWCGERVGWPAAGGVVFADGTAAHAACYEPAETQRARGLRIEA